MIPNTLKPSDFSQFLNPSFPSRTQSLRPPSICCCSSSSASQQQHLYRLKSLGFKRSDRIGPLAKCNELQMRFRHEHLCKALSSSSSESAVISKNDGGDDQEEMESTRLFEKLKDAERERINKLEQLESKANMQLERQLVMASCWSRALLTMQGKLKGTEWDPENSHRIDYSEFWRLLNSNNVQYMEYSNFGQTVSVILPYYKDGKESEGNSNREIVYRRHVVDRMPIDAWNDVWQKLHQQLVNVDVFNVDPVPAEVYSTVATAVIWSMRLALSIGLYLWIDSFMRPIYAKLIPCDLGKPQKTASQQLRRYEFQNLGSLGSLGKSR